MLAPQIDLAELVGLLTLYHLCKEIESMYKPGAQVLLYTEEPFIASISTIVQRNLHEPLYAEGHIEQYQVNSAELVSHFYPTIVMRRIAHLSELYDACFARLPVKSVDLEGYKMFMKQELKCVRFIEAAKAVLFRELAQKEYPDLQGMSFANFCQRYGQSQDKAHKRLYNQINSSKALG